MTGRTSDDEFDAYKALQVDPEAEPEVIQAAFRRLAQKWHPDVAQSQDAAARMTAINRAWKLVGELESRQAYDRRRAAMAAERDARAQTGFDDPRTAGVRRSPAGSASQGGPTVPPPERVSRDWTSGRSSMGSGYDPASMRTADGMGAAGHPPGNPSGSVLNFGRYTGWSLGEIGRTDIDYVEWLDRTPIGRPYREEIDSILRRAGRRRSEESQAVERRGLFRRR